MSEFFKILKRDSSGKARTCEITTVHGTIKTPVYMPVGTKATIKALDHRTLYGMGCQILL